MSQLQLREMIFCSNSREQEEGQGSPISGFLGHGVRTGLPNSVNRDIDWNYLMEIRATQHQKRVDKPGKMSNWKQFDRLAKLFCDYYFVIYDVSMFRYVVL